MEQRDDAAIDIADEFERQFFGDLMLFSVVAWLKQHSLDQLADVAAVEQGVTQVEAGMLAQYAATHRAVNDRLAELERWRGAAPPGWHGTSALARIEQFLRNMAANFGDASPAWQQIQSESHRATRRAQIVDALTHYREERGAWDRLFTR